MNRYLRTDDRCGAADTTAIGLTFAFYFTVADRKVWDRLSRELRMQFKSIDEITGQATEGLPFLNAVIFECISPVLAFKVALRYYPPVTVVHPRVTPPEGMMIAGRYVCGNVQSICLALLKFRRK